MTDKRYHELMRDDSLPITKQEMDQGWHFCYEWDGLLVGPGMSEQDFCSCFPKHRKKYGKKHRKEEQLPKDFAF
jgi:hypothetical protein